MFSKAKEGEEFARSGPRVTIFGRNRFVHRHTDLKSQNHTVFPHL